MSGARKNRPQTSTTAKAPEPAAAKRTEVKITPAKGRPMLTWVGKRPLSHVTAFPAQHEETFDPVGAGLALPRAQRAAPPTKCNNLERLAFCLSQVRNHCRRQDHRHARRRGPCHTDDKYESDHGRRAED